MSTYRATSTQRQWSDVQAVWDYQQLHHELRPCSAAIALGSFDLGVAAHAAHLFHEGYFSRLVFSGATSPTTATRFPRGEAVEYREHAISLGVPDNAILVEPQATNTGENIVFSRELLRQSETDVTDLMVVCMPFMERRAYATCAKQWPEVSVVCTSAPISLIDYVDSIGDERTVINELVGDLQRIWRYPQKGFAIEQHVPKIVMESYRRLVDAGFTAKLLP